MSLAIWFIGTLGGFLLGAAFWVGLATSDFESRAIEAGVGFYNDKTGEFEFIMIDKN